MYSTTDRLAFVAIVLTLTASLACLISIPTMIKKSTNLRRDLQIGMSDFKTLSDSTWTRLMALRNAETSAVRVVRQVLAPGRRDGLDEDNDDANSTLPSNGIGDITDREAETMPSALPVSEEFQETSWATKSATLDLETAWKRIMDIARNKTEQLEVSSACPSCYYGKSV